MAGRLFVDAMNEPDSMGIKWEAQESNPGAEQLYLATAEALWNISPQKVFFMFEGAFTQVACVTCARPPSRRSRALTAEQHAQCQALTDMAMPGGPPSAGDQQALTDTASSARGCSRHLRGFNIASPIPVAKMGGKHLAKPADDVTLPALTWRNGRASACFKS